MKPTIMKEEESVRIVVANSLPRMQATKDVAVGRNT
jgi:hypothetical protein